jgi:hypothetical protein
VATLAPSVATLVGMRLILAMLVAGCGTSGASPAADAGSAPVVYCSTLCGTVDAGADGSSPCPAGDICGQTGGIPGFICCNPEASADCNPGQPGPGDCP